MALTKYTAATPFIARGTMRLVVVTTAPAGATATRAELNAGKDVADECTGLEGFTYSTSFAEFPVLGAFKKIKLAASQSAADSSLTFQQSADGTGAAALFTELSIYYILMLYGGDLASTGKMDQYKVQCGGVNAQPSFGDEPMQTKVDFAVLSVTRAQTIPA
jgi:hypothetical protein